MDEVPDVNQEQEQVAFRLGDGTISLSELDKLLSRKDPTDRETLKSIVILAATNGNHDITNYLFSQGYQLEVLNDKNQTHLAYYTDTYEIISQSGGQAFSCCKNYTNYIDCNGLSHLHIACATGFVEIVEQFLNNGEDINGCLTSDCSRGRKGFTPLHFAVAHHEIEVVELLLERGADINAVDSFGCTPLLLACPVSWLFRRHRDFDNLLQTKSYTSELKILKLLLEYKSDFNARNNDGNTPLLNVFKSDYYHHQLHSEEILPGAPFIIQRLETELHKRQVQKFLTILSCGADITALNNNDENIFHCMIEYLNFVRLIVFPVGISFPFLHDHAPSILIDALLKGILTPKVLEALQNKQLDINAKNKNGETPIALAVSIISYEVVKVLLDFGADVNSIVINSREFFRYPNIVPSVDVVFVLKSLIALLVNNEFNLTLEANLAIMKLLVHTDVSDCDCDKVARNTSNVFLALFHLISHSSPIHLKRVFMKLYHSLDETLKLILLEGFRMHLEICKLIAYKISIDEETLQLLYEKDLSLTHDALIETLTEDITRMKSNKLKNGVDLCEILTNKHTRNVNIIKNFDLDDVSIIMQKSFSTNVVRGYVKDLMVRMYVEPAAYKNYIGLVMPFLPDVLRKMILEYLDTEDIVNLCVAALLE